MLPTPDLPASTEARVDERIQVVSCLRDMAGKIGALARIMGDAMTAGNRVFFFGNGGSAASLIESSMATGVAATRSHPA